MWSKIGQYLIQFLLLPLLKEIFEVIVKYFKRKNEAEQAKVENKEKVKEYIEAKDEASELDSFNKLP